MTLPYRSLSEELMFCNSGVIRRGNLAQARDLAGSIIGREAQNARKSLKNRA
jgi:hypothetical protein